MLTLGHVDIPLYSFAAFTNTDSKRLLVSHCGSNMSARRQDVLHCVQTQLSRRDGREYSIDTEPRAFFHLLRRSQVVASVAFAPTGNTTSTT